MGLLPEQSREEKMKECQRYIDMLELAKQPYRFELDRLIKEEEREKGDKHGMDHKFFK